MGIVWCFFGELFHTIYILFDRVLNKISLFYGLLGKFIVFILPGEVKVYTLFEKKKVGEVKIKFVFFFPG